MVYVYDKGEGRPLKMGGYVGLLRRTLAVLDHQLDPMQKRVWMGSMPG
jgi:hypothetical protein